MLDSYFTETMNEGQKGLRTACALAAKNGVPAPS